MTPEDHAVDASGTAASGGTARTDVAVTGDIVQVQVPAAVAYLATLRLMAASLAARCELTVDDIEDLRLAVDEACALLLPHAPRASTLRATFVLSVGTLTVTAAIDSPDASDDSGAGLDRSGFAWSVLSALADDVEVDGSAGELAITVTKRREHASR